jgi:hypothetical protein
MIASDFSFHIEIVLKPKCNAFNASSAWSSSHTARHPWIGIRLTDCLPDRLIESLSKFDRL